MSTYGIDVYALGDATVSHAGIIEEHYDGLQWEWYSGENNTLSVNSGATPTHVTISDSDGAPTTLEDDSTGQVNTGDVVIGGTTYPAGTEFQDEYEIDLTDGSTTYRMVAISYRDYIDQYTWNDIIIGFTFEGPVPPADTSLDYVIGSAADSQSMVVCFTPGTLIDTPSGPRPVETLRTGDRVRSPNGSLHRLIWTGRRHLSAARLAAEPRLRPVLIRAGALGHGLPRTDLLLSPQHRLLVRSAIALRVGGSAEVLVAAKHLLGNPGIAQVLPPDGVDYLHLLCARHVILSANGARAESLYPGPEAWRGLGRAARHALSARLGAGAALAPARPILPPRLGRELAGRHAMHHRALQ